MAEQRMVVEIGGDVSQLNKALQSGEASLKKFQKATVQTGTTVTNLARIAQDAPFGFIAIQNNLDPLIQSFGQLKAQSGGTGQALKALFASLAGPAGVALGFSVVSSAVTTLIQKYGSLSNAVTALTNANNEQFVKLQEIKKIQTEATEIAGKEIARLNILNSIITDNNAQLDLRKRAIIEIRKEYGQYLKGISDEALLNNQATDAINKATQAILNKSLAIAAEKKLAEVGSKLLENQLALTTAVENYQRASENNRKANERSLSQGVKGIAAVNTETVAYNTELEKTRTNLENLGKENQKLEADYKRILDLGRAFAGKAGVNFFKPLTAAPTKSGQKAAVQVPIIPSLESVENFANTADRLINDQFERSVPVEIPVLPTVPEKVIKQFKEFGDLKKAIFDNAQLRKQAEEFKQILQTGLAVPLGDLFFNFLDSGKFAFKDFADAAIKAIKRIVAQLVATKIIQLLGNLVFPGGGKAAGGIFGGLSSLLGGGVAAPNFGGVSGGGLSGQVVFVQRGTDLVGVLQRSTNRINRVG